MKRISITQMTTMWPNKMLGAIVMRIYLILLVLLTACATRPESAWHRYDAGSFSFLIPPDLKKTDAHGIDSYASEFKSPNMELSFDYGFYSSNFREWPDSTSFEVATIDGRPAKIGSISEGFHRRFSYCTMVSFRDIKPTVHLSMFASCKTPQDSLIAKRIFYSIKFKQE